MNNPTKQELAWLHRFAFKCFGHNLTEGRTIDLWRLAHGQKVINEDWPTRPMMIAMANNYMECLNA